MSKHLELLRAIYSAIENVLRNSGAIAGKSGRHMKYPYTISAKIAQFPYFHHIKSGTIWTYYPLGLITAFYFFGKIHSFVNSPENVKSWAETQRRAAEKEHH